MRFIVLFILLAFPVIDLMVTMRFARWTGIPTLVWLLASAAIGTLLLRHERGGFRARTLGALRGDQPLMRGLIDSGRKVLAGMLFILPGLLSDLLAVALGGAVLGVCAHGIGGHYNQPRSTGNR